MINISRFIINGIRKFKDILRFSLLSMFNFEKQSYYRNLEHKTKVSHRTFTFKRISLLHISGDIFRKLSDIPDFYFIGDDNT